MLSDGAAPEGLVEQREAFSFPRRIREWLRSHSAIIEIGGTILLHGGISPSVASMRPDDINTRIHDESRALDAAMQYFENGGLILPFSICRKSQLCCKRNFWPNANPEYQPTSRVSGSPNSWIMEIG
jgi:hypothetical protein